MMRRIKFVFAWLLTLFVVVNAMPPFGIQSGGGISGTAFAGSSYAGAMSYDVDSDVVYVTGATYSSFFDVTGTAPTASTTSNCFLVIVSIPTSTERNASFQYKENYGTPNVDESCSSLTRADSKIYIGGQSEEGGLLTSLRSVGSTTSLQYGTILDIDVDFTLTNATLLGGRLLHDTHVQSAQAVVLSPTGDSIFVVSQESDLTTQNNDFDPNKLEPNLVEQPKWGSNFVLNVVMYNRRTVESGTGSASNPATTFDSALWNTQIATNQQPVEVAGISLFSRDNALLVAGSAIGSNEDSIPTSITNGWAGFLTLLDSGTGDVLKKVRVETQYGMVTRIEGICKHPDRENEIYVVGSTNGYLELADYQEQELTAFVMRISLPDLKVTWGKQLGSKTGPLSMNWDGAAMTGRACAVMDDGVYVGGVVMDGSVVNRDLHSSAGQDDIWVGFINTTTGEFSWTRQLGTPDNEHLSALAVDKNGDVLVLGNSNGSFMREKNKGDDSTDIFLLRLTKLEGEFPMPISDKLRPVPDTNNGQPATVPDLAVPEENNSSDAGGSNAGIIAVVVVVASALLLTVGCFIYKRRQRDRRSKTDSSCVTTYVGTFDDVDVDLNRTATGGWRGTYVNHDGGPRFFSDDGMPCDGVITFSGKTMSPVTHSAIIEDALFSWDDDEPGPGGDAIRPGDFHPRPSSYRGLVNVYNHYDLSPHRLPSGVKPRVMVDVDFDEEMEEVYLARWGNEII